MREIENFSTLKELCNLESIDLSFTQFSDLSILTCNNSLINLDISGNNVKNLNSLVNFKNLKSITLSVLKENDIQIMKKMSYLKIINIRTEIIMDSKQKQEIKKQLKNKQVNFI